MRLSHMTCAQLRCIVRSQNNVYRTPEPIPITVRCKSVIQRSFRRSLCSKGGFFRADQGTIFQRCNIGMNPQNATKPRNQVEVSSKGKARNVRKSLGLERETLNGEMPAPSHRALLTSVSRIGPDDPELAVQTAEKALRQAANSSNDEAIASALHALGKTLMSAGRVEDALRTLSKYLAVAKRIPDPEGVCDAHMELAFAHKALGNTEGTIKHLDSLQRYSSRHKLSYKLAQAHYYTGEYLLNKSQAHLATPHLELALDQFRSLGKNAEAERARCAAGISKGQEVMESYVDLISNSPQGNPEAITKICDWKNDRVPFWPSS